ncbi:Positive regulator of CheA protein activity (CheW) [Caenispirillum salinarum AK4]|uniref:Positive regulator of CheA protein activity (CheW) n=1 Tax=Caenispirillum salinarum AK4 TaxID=1238182 RepID=K9GY33_9PROT|nr:chemotaxis protein CheW [Caenispirillum salinarum]EKV30142.1 Positive regulator of CheA protein activity (CheW) [Caenispirillum salinarum AK4]
MTEMTPATQSRAVASTDAQHQANAMQSADEQVFVTVYVADQLFGLAVERVQDILIPEKVARIPLAPPEVAGSINLRGRIVTVIDVRTRLGLPPKKSKGNIMCVTVEQGQELYSLQVDSVGNVQSLPVSRIEPNPSTLDPRWRGISSGVVRLEGELMVVLDIDAFLDFGN